MNCNFKFIIHVLQFMLNCNSSFLFCNFTTSKSWFFNWYESHYMRFVADSSHQFVADSESVKTSYTHLISISIISIYCQDSLSVFIYCRKKNIEYHFIYCPKFIIYASSIYRFTYYRSVLGMNNNYIFK